MKLSERVREFRMTKGYSHQELADLLGVNRVTVLRWETGTSKPSPLAAEKLERLGFGRIEHSETKRISTPRIVLESKTKLRKAVRASISIGGKSYAFDPSPYVINGPEDQIPLFETLYQLQELNNLPCSDTEYARRLSLVASVPELVPSTAQHDLERSTRNSKHWDPNYGSHGWHRYVGRFPPHLVRALINHFDAKKGELVCDPFAGSGTTLVESRLLGLKAIGIEICPLSSLISRTKSKFPSSTSSLEPLIEKFNAFYQEKHRQFVGRRNIKDISHHDAINREGNTIPPFANYEKWLIPEALLGTSIIVEFAESLSGFERDLICCALSSCMRSIGNVDVDVVRAEYRKTPRQTVDVRQIVHKALRRIIRDIELTVSTHYDLLSPANDINVVEGSILDVSLPQESVDYIITSPPYGVESLSYLRTHLLSYRCLQPIIKYDPYAFNDKIIGSEYLKENGNSPSQLAGMLSETFTEFFENQLPKGLSSKLLIRKSMMIQFMDDMARVARLFSQWLRPGGRLAFVIGNKKIGDSVIPTDNIIAEFFSSFGLRLDEAIGHKLKCNNSNSEVPWQERTIQDEHVMIFTRTKGA